MWRDARREIWTVLGLLLVMGIYLYGTFQYSPQGQSGVPNARTFPFLILAILTLLIVALLWTSRSPTSGPTIALEEDDEDVRLVEDPSLARLGLLIVMLLAYLLVMPQIGFLVSTVLLGIVMQIVIFRASWLMSVVVSVALAAGAYGLFSSVLSIPLP